MSAASDTQRCPEPLGWSSAESMRDLLDSLTAAIRIFRVLASQLVQPLAEDPAVTTCIRAAPPADPYLHPDRHSLHGQIRQSTDICTVPGF